MANKIPFISRVNQIDAAQLDDEIYRVLHAQVGSSISRILSPGKVAACQPEIDIVLRFLIWNYSLRAGNSTFGQQLLNLKYENLDTRKAIFLFLLTTVPKYVQQRLFDSRFSRIREESKLSTLVQRIEDMCRVATFINTLVFLTRGNQPRLVEKILGINNSSTVTREVRNIGYSYMARELIWHGLIELFAIGLPMIDFRNLGQTWKRLWGKRKQKTKMINVISELTQESLCPCCRETPVMPIRAGCEHFFCYYCLSAWFTTTEVYQCPTCDTELRAKDARSCLALKLKPLRN